MLLYDGDGNVVSTPKGFNITQGAQFRLIPVTHDESTFYAEDQRKNYWHPPGQKPVPERKGEGESLMVSEFLTVVISLSTQYEREPLYFHISNVSH